MRISNTTAGNQNIKSKNISYKGGREVLRTLSNPDSLMSTIVLESSVTGGRGINAYKRGGFHEFRERFTDDVVSAVFWMKGVDIFNSIGDKFGQKVLKLPTTEFDVGKDALRTPFKNVVADLGEKAADAESLKKLENKLAAFKFTKIILSTLLATGFVGFALPKINQAITEKLMSDDKKHKKNEKKLNQTINEFDIMNRYSMEEFEKQLGQRSSVPSFKGLSPQMMTTVAHALESNKICKMLTCDVGILTGRVKTARNADEGREYFFRDASSSFFYFASTPLVYKLLQTATGSAKTTSLDPVAAKQLHQVMSDQLKNADGSFVSMNVKDFAAKTIGVLDDKSKELISKLPFNSDVISLKELSKYITDENLLSKALEMSKLQPKQAGIGNVLTKQQVADVLKNGAVNTPEFMHKAYTSRFGETLINPYRFIPMKKITSFRDNIDKYAQSVIDTAAKKNGGIVDKKLLDNINRKSLIMSAGFRAVAIGFSALALGVIIPKLQYAMTEKRTGRNAAPGLRKFEESEETETKKA